MKRSPKYRFKFSITISHWVWAKWIVLWKKHTDPVREGQEFISFLRIQGQIFGFHTGDYDHIVRSLLPRSMLPTLSQGYRTLPWSSGREACDPATANDEIEGFLTTVGNVLFWPDASKISNCTKGAKETKAVCHTTDSNRSHEPRLYSRIVKQVSKDGWHLVEAIGSATWLHRHCVFGRPSFEKLQTSDFPLPGWIFLRFSPAIWVLLYTQTVF